MFRTENLKDLVFWLSDFMERLSVLREGKHLLYYPLTFSMLLSAATISDSFSAIAYPFHPHAVRMHKDDGVHKV